ncbi:MAG: asparagine synthase (glutamine-hydrolyzing) [Candidatus Scalindua sp.]
MCGIAGWFSERTLDSESEERLNKMIGAINHRGPDAKGRFYTSHAALGHARLSIIDLDSGQQPMTSADGQLTIVFNGEIYNHQALRKECQNKGYIFKTRSDTEVILGLYTTGGIQSVNRLRGMFAFALWDHKTREGWLVRDPLGIKPLFYHMGQQGRLIFSSEVKAIIASGFYKAELDIQSLHLLMNFRYLPGSHTLFNEVQQLPPNQILHWAPNKTTKITTIPQENCQNSEGAIPILEDSVAKHLVSDVEVGAYLSGGIDSATIVALARKQYTTPMKTFTLDVGDDPMESRYAARTAELLDVTNVVAQGSTVTESSLKQMLWHLETPKINAYQVYKLASLASKHVKVCLSGLGGDELFLGYNAHGIMNKARILKHFLPTPLSQVTGKSLSALIRNTSPVPWTERERATLMLQSLGDWPRVYGLLRNIWDSPVLKTKIYGPRLLDQQLPNAFDYISDRWPRNADPVTAMAEYETREKMVNDLLWQEDRLSMAHGLEVRVPFVDKMMFQYFGKLDRSTLMPNGRLKGYMKQTIASILPEEILQRPKSGFQVNAPKFYQKELVGLAKKYLSPDRLRETGLFNPEFVKNIEKLPANKHFRWHFFMLYMMLMTHMWLEVFDSK